MDPDENLDKQRFLRKRILDPKSSYARSIEDGEELVNNADALDEWIVKGGFLPATWELNCNGGLLKRAKLAQEVFQTLIKETESLEGELGMQVGYLLGAILDNGEVELHMDIRRDIETKRVFEQMFPKGHPVWSYINIVQPGG